MWICNNCGQSNSDNECIGEHCGSYKEEPAYDAIDDEGKYKCITP